MNGSPEIYSLYVTPKKRTGETVAILVTLALLFLLLILMVGHPGPPPHSPQAMPHASAQPR